MTRKISIINMLLALILVAAVQTAFAAGPDFSKPAIFADGEAWATKGVADLPAPNDNNHQSFDKLFSFTNGASGQLPVAEAAPTNPEYNAGRWDLHLATWIIADPPIVYSYAELQGYVADGYLLVTSAHSYFECPLLPLH